MFISLILVVICWTITPFLKKYTNKNLFTNEYLLIHNYLITFLITIYLLLNNNINLKEIRKKLSLNQFLILNFSCLITIFSTVLLWHLLKYNDVSYIIPLIQPVVILLTYIIGIFLGEKISIYKIIGGLLIISGIFILELNNKIIKKKFNHTPSNLI